MLRRHAASGGDGPHADLSGADLSSADLSGAASASYLAAGPRFLVLGCKFDVPVDERDENESRDPDYLRLFGMRDIYPSALVYGCTEKLCSEGRAHHIFARNFTNPRVVKDILECFPGGVSAVFLDYFWLQTGWYRHRYGGDWFAWSRAAFSQMPALQCCILPVDGGRARCGGGQSDMLAALQTFEDRGGDGAFDVHLMTLLEAETYHPLVLATMLVDNELNSHFGKSARTHDHQVEWLWGHADGQPHHSRPRSARNDRGGGPCFIVVCRKGLNWKEWLLGLQNLQGLVGSRVHAGDNANGAEGVVKRVLFHGADAGRPRAVPQLKLDWECGRSTLLRVTDAVRLILV